MPSLQASSPLLSADSCWHCSAPLVAYNEAIAPEILPYDVGNALSAMLKRKQITQKEEVEVRRRDGTIFSLTSKASKTASPFDVPGIKTKATTANILAAIKDSRLGQSASRGSLTLRIRMTNVAFLSDVSIILLPNRFFCLTWLSSDVH